MRRFHFRLQSILDLRVHQENEKKLELGRITAECHRLDTEIADRVARRRAVLTEAYSATDSADCAVRNAIAAYALRLSAEAERLRAERAEREKERRLAADAYREARRNAEVLTRLRERQERAHSVSERRVDQYRIDEIAQRMAAGAATGTGG